MSGQVSVAFSFPPVGVSSFEHFGYVKSHFVGMWVEETSILALLGQDRRNGEGATGLMCPDIFKTTPFGIGAYDLTQHSCVGGLQEFSTFLMV